MLDELTELLRTSADLVTVPEGHKNAMLSERGIDATKFRVVRAEWARMSTHINARKSLDYTGVGVYETRLRCAILAGTHWVSSFDRHGILQNISPCSVLYDSKFDIQGYGPSDLVVVGWNFPLSAQDLEWDMDSEGYPLTMVQKSEMEHFAPDLLDLPEVKEQLAGLQPPAWVKQYAQR